MDLFSMLSATHILMNTFTLPYSQKQIFWCIYTLSPTYNLVCIYFSMLSATHILVHISFYALNNTCSLLHSPQQAIFPPKKTSPLRGKNYGHYKCCFSHKEEQQESPLSSTGLARKAVLVILFSGRK